MTRFMIGALFLLVAVFEVGSHSYLDAHHHDAEAPAIAIDQHHSGLEDFCEPFFGCVDEHDDHESQQPNAQDQSTHHDMLATSNVVLFVRNTEIIERYVTPGSSARFRPPALPFHPPKTA